MKSQRFKDRYNSFANLRASHYMGLSLYILLLAFFIALTSLFDVSTQRSQSVMSSVKESFYQSSFIINDVKSGSESETGNIGLLPEKQVEKLMGKSLGDLKIERRHLDNGKFQLSATLSQVLFKNYADAFARELSNIINNPKISTDFDVEIIVDSGYSQKTLSEDIIQKFRANDFPLENLSMGLTGHDAGQDIELKFIFAQNYEVLDAFDSVPSDRNEEGEQE